ncbi:MAG: hypothetical protein HC822_20885, partial [Oscillochloris sp.]|nr:hypothetical protein [Oscillochloris sp.]
MKARVSDESETTEIDWSHESAWRFLPLVALIVFYNFILERDRLMRAKALELRDPPRWLIRANRLIPSSTYLFCSCLPFSLQKPSCSKPSTKPSKTSAPSKPTAENNVTVPQTPQTPQITVLP